MKRSLIFLLLTSAINFAHATQWQIIPCLSNLSFTATQNDSPTSGTLNFTGSGSFDQSQLSTSNVNITVDMNSVLTPTYQQIQDTLKMPDWFNVKVFPQATFSGTKFSILTAQEQQAFLASQKLKLDDVVNHFYKVDGTLSLRGISAPMQLIFVLTKNDGAVANAFGVGVVKRLKFGVGQGEWASTSTVKDDVAIHFNLVAVNQADPDVASKLTASCKKPQGAKS